MAAQLRYIKYGLFFVVLNLIALNGFVVGQMIHKGTVLGETTANACPQACITRINAAAGKSASSSVKEYFIPLGTGSNASDEWTDVAGASAYVDSTSYAKLKKVTFEATIYQPASSQRVWIRLYNATDGRVIANSELSSDNSGPIALTSPAVNLDYGNKLYQVQMKTQLRGLTNLTQARIHILTN